MIISICGVKGCFSEIVVEKYLCNYSKIKYTNTIEQALHLVQQNLAHYAVIPVKTTTLDKVNGIQDFLLHNRQWRIIKEMELVTHYCLMALIGDGLDSINKILSHEVALKECSQYLHSLDVMLEAYYNTAASAKHIASNQLRHTAAIAPKIAATHYALEILAENIENDVMVTTFYQVGYSHSEGE